MNAILRTWRSELYYEDSLVQISDNHHFEDGPYVDTVPFSVGSNQEILSVDDFSYEYIRMLSWDAFA